MTIERSILLCLCILDRFIFQYKQYYGQEIMNISDSLRTLWIIMHLQKVDGLSGLMSFLVAKKFSTNI